MPAQKIYANPETPIVFQASGGDVTFTPQNVAAGAGRISNVWDRGAGAKPMRYKWRASTKWAATRTANDALRIYLVTSNAAATPALTDGTMTFGDAGVAAEAELINHCALLGSIVCPTTTDQAECASGIIEVFDRYIAVAWWNGAAAKALTNTAGDHIFSLTAVPDEIQA